MEVKTVKSIYASAVFVVGLIALCGLTFVTLAAMVPESYHKYLAAGAILVFGAVMVLWPGQYKFTNTIKRQLLGDDTDTDVTK